MLCNQDELCKTPEYLLDQDIFSKTQYSGFAERILPIQLRTLNDTLRFGKMARLKENETANGSISYTLIDMTSELRKGIWSELPAGRKIDRYRRNIQKVYIDRLAYIMTT